MLKKNLWLIISVLLYFPLFCSANILAAFDYPKRSSLVDTGYDLCMQWGGTETACRNNKNLLFRGSNTFNSTNITNHDDFYSQLFNYLQSFKANTQTKAVLPQSLAEFKSYRIIIINLMDGTPNEPPIDPRTVIAEYNGSGVPGSNNTNLPLQHRLYGNNRPFSSSQYDFEWWPTTYYYWNTKPFFNAPNSPEKNTIIPGTHPPINYVSQDLSYMVTGTPYPGDKEMSAADIKDLLLAKPQDPAHPLLVYYHCAGGKDRTGLVTMGYFMTNGGYANIDLQQKIPEQRQPPMSYSQALNATTKGNWPKPKSIPLAKEYCQSLPGHNCN